MDDSQQVYKSTTLGPIPLSFTGRHLLQALREEMTDAIAKAQKGNWEGYKDWNPLSVARGRLAKYMSHMERKHIQNKRVLNTQYGRYSLSDAEPAMLMKGVENDAPPASSPPPWSPNYRASEPVWIKDTKGRTHISQYSVQELQHELKRRSVNLCMPPHCINCRCVQVPIPDSTKLSDQWAKGKELHPILALALKRSKKRVKRSTKTKRVRK